MACLASPRHVWIVQLALTFHSRLHSTTPSTSQDAYRSSGEAPEAVERVQHYRAH